jgi:hypothetical protein
MKWAFHGERIAQECYSKNEATRIFYGHAAEAGDGGGPYAKTVRGAP